MWAQSKALGEKRHRSGGVWEEKSNCVQGLSIFRVLILNMTLNLYLVESSLK